LAFLGFRINWFFLRLKFFWFYLDVGSFDGTKLQRVKTLACFLSVNGKNFRLKTLKKRLNWLSLSIENQPFSKNTQLLRKST
jgi:hypothetical protein